MILPADDLPIKARCSTCHAEYKSGRPFAHRPGCAQMGRASTEATLVMRAPVAKAGATKPKRDGSHAQDALYAALVAAGYVDFGSARMDYGYALFPQSLFVREFAWGSHLKPARRFQADVCFPASRLLVEIEGISHKIGSRQKGDVLKSQLATEAGFTLLRVLPEQVRDGSAVVLIAAALAAKEE